MANRDLLIVQDFVRVDGSGTDDVERESWFYTYNHDLEHPYFSPRDGFTRASVKNQGMVGIASSAGLTRLTWLCNMEFGGLIPSAFTNEILVTLMALPLTTVRDTKLYLQKKKRRVTHEENKNQSFLLRTQLKKKEDEIIELRKKLMAISQAATREKLDSHTTDIA